MKQKEFMMIAKVLFATIAVVHLARAILGWPVQIIDINIPVWVSYIVAILFGYLAYTGYRSTK